MPAIHRLWKCVVAAATAVSLCAAPAPGQCGEWIIGPGQGPAGFNPGATAFCSALWDPDGEGPAREVVAIGGQWHLLVTPDLWGSVVTWDGVEWRGLGLSLASSQQVWGLAGYNGLLIAAGNFPGGVRQWNGATWEIVGGGVTGVPSAMTVYGGELIVAGSITAAGGASMSSIARWNGSQWRPLGSGVTGSVGAVLVFDGELIVGGNFTIAGDVEVDRIARWNGSEWTAMGGGMGTVRCLGTWGGNLVAGTATGVYQWDGTQWSRLGTLSVSVRALADHEGALLACTGPVHRWDGTAWTSITGFSQGVTNTLASYGGEVIAAGSFSVIDGRFISRVARWDGMGWHTVGGALENTVNPVGFVGDIAEHDGKIVFTGAFDRVDGAGGVAGAATWDGTRWQVIGPPGGGAARAVAVRDGDLFLGTANGVWRWDGTSWTSLGFLSNVVDVHAEGEDVFAATLSRVHQWNGSGWDALGGTTSGVKRLAFHGGRLFVLGNFTAIGQVPAARIAAWNGSEWEPLGTGLDGAAHAALSDQDGLYVGGAFTSAGGVQTRAVARWDGAAWHGVGSGISGTVEALARQGGMLVAGGSLSAGGELTAPGIAYCDGDGPWIRGGTVNYLTVNALLEHRGELIVAGGFFMAGDHLTHYWSRWTLGAPSIAQSPQDVAAPAGGDVVLDVNVEGTGSLEPAYRWRRSGIDIEDGTTPHGSVVSGAATAVLSISGARPADAGMYDVRVSTTCGEATSEPALVTVACPADWTGDGAVNSTDISAFLADWVASVQGGTLDADFDADGAVDSVDISAFLTAWIAGLTGGC